MKIDENSRQNVLRSTKSTKVDKVDKFNKIDNLAQLCKKSTKIEKLLYNYSGLLKVGKKSRN